MDLVHGWNDNRPPPPVRLESNNDIPDKRGFTSSGSCRLTILKYSIFFRIFTVRRTINPGTAKLCLLLGRSDSPEVSWRSVSDMLLLCMEARENFRD